MAEKEAACAVMPQAVLDPYTRVLASVADGNSFDLCFVSVRVAAVNGLCTSTLPPELLDCLAGIRVASALYSHPKWSHFVYQW